MLQFSRLTCLSVLSLLIWQVEGAKAASLLPVEQSVEQAQMSEDAVVSVLSPAGAVSLDEQFEGLLRAARTSAKQGDPAAALSQLDQATVLVKTLPVGEDRDRLLSSIGSRLMEIKAFDRAEAIAQVMTYDTLGSTWSLRTELEVALIKAYIQAEQTPQVIQLIQSFDLEGRDFYWLSAVEALANQGDVKEAENLFENVKDQDYLYYTDVNSDAINQAYIGAGQFAAAQNFLAQHPVSDPSQQTFRVAELALWAGRANQMEEAEAIAQQIPAGQRAETLLELAKLYQARDQIVRAVDRVAEAAALPQMSSGDPDNDWWTNFSGASKIASAYASLGKPEAAQQVLNDAKRRNITPPESPDRAPDWAGAYASIGDFEQASQLLVGLTDYTLSNGQFNLATAYVDQAQYEPAFTLLSQIPDGTLATPGYSDPKLDLLNQIVKDATQQDQFAVAQSAVPMMREPSDRVLAWVAIAAAYQSKQQTSEAINTLDQALTVANTIDSYGVELTRNDYFVLSNAELLTAIAEGYWAAGQQDKAIATAQSAIQSAQAFKSDVQSSGFNLDSLKRVAQLGHDWQQPDLRRAAMLVEQTQLTAAIEDTAQTAWPELLIDQLTRLVALSDEPGIVSAEVVTRSLNRLEILREQASDLEQQLTILNSLISLYGLNNQPDLMRSSFEQALAVIAPLNRELRDNSYTRLAVTLGPDSELSSQVLSLLSPRGKVNTLLKIAQQLAAKDQSTQAVEQFEEAVNLADTWLSVGDRDSTITFLSYWLNAGDNDHLFQHTPTELLLLSQLSQHISNPSLRVNLLFRLMLNLPSLEAQAAYEALPSALADIPSAYTRRDVLWQAIDKNVDYKQFEQATQLANALDGEYRQSALGLVEVARHSTGFDGN